MSVLSLFDILNLKHMLSSVTDILESGIGTCTEKISKVLIGSSSPFIFCLVNHSF